MFDPYKVLNVSRDCDIPAIKGAFRRMCLKHHPDKNLNDDSARERFHDITKAYAILIDPVKRGVYDRTGKAELSEDVFAATRLGDTRFNMMDGVFFSFEEFENFPEFKAQEHSVKANVFEEGSLNSPSAEGSYKETVVNENRFNVKVSLKELLFGCEKTVTVNAPVMCPNCNGEGRINIQSQDICEKCWGSDPHCPVCHGSMESFMMMHIGAQTLCSACKGKGSVSNKTKQTIKIPAGISDHYCAHVKAKHGPPILVSTTTELPPTFFRRDVDLCWTMRIEHWESLCGCKRRLKLPDDNIVSIQIPGIVKEGCEWKITGRGIPHVGNPTLRGDLVINIIIKWPKNGLGRKELQKITNQMPDEALSAENVVRLNKDQKELWKTIMH